MGSCTSKKRSNQNKIIVSNALINNQQLKSQKILNYNYQNTFPKSLKLIITEIKNELVINDNIIIDIEPNKTLNDLYIQININTKSEYDIKLSDEQIITNIRNNKTIFDILFPYISKINNFQNKINITLIYKGLQIPDNIIEAYIGKNPIIGSPIFDNPDYIAIVTFNTKNKELKLFNYNQKDREFSLLNKFNSFTAYCNANGYLYISGGEDEQSQDFEKSVIEFNDFFCIDLNRLNSNNNNIFNDNNLSDNLTNTNDKNDFYIKHLPNLLEPRTWHSMIFVPDKYIFIVGGSTKSVELYDIEKNILTKDSELNEMRNECSLCMVNNTYLYCFFGFLLHQTFNCTVERCNLRKNLRIWEYVQFNTNENMEFIPSFFCASYYKNNEIILFGGNDSIEETNKSYIVKIRMEEDNLDEINELSNFDGEKLGVFRDKLFTPIDNNYAINIPLIYGENIQLLFFNMDSGEIERKDYNDIFNNE